jgi:hypothetical protein
MPSPRWAGSTCNHSSVPVSSPETTLSEKATTCPSSSATSSVWSSSCMISARRSSSYHSSMALVIACGPSEYEACSDRRATSLMAGLSAGLAVRMSILPFCVPTVINVQSRRPDPRCALNMLISPVILDTVP